MQFDMKTQPWFIRTGTPEKSKLIQEWLFEQGCEWLYGKNLQTGINENFITNTNCVGDVEKWLMFSCANEKLNAKEIKLTFKTVIDSVEYPAIESEQDKKIKELQETIEKAQQQIVELKGLK